MAQTFRSPFGDVSGGGNKPAQFQQPFGAPQAQPVQQPKAQGTTVVFGAPQQNQAPQAFQAFAEVVDNPFTSAIANMGKQQISNLVSKSQFSSEYVTSKIFNNDSRYYFDVDNQYVLKKLVKIVYPFKLKYTSSSYSVNDFDHFGSQESSENAAPKQNLDAPDLYIPLMALMTYTLISCLTYGIGEDFQPEIIRNNLSQCLFFSAAELLLFKLGMFFLQIKNVGFVSLLAYLSYRYVALSIILVFGLVFGSGWITNGVILYLMVSKFLFVSRQLQRFNTSGSADSSQGGAQ